MFGGYADLYAYGVDNNSRRKNTIEETATQSSFSGAETEPDCCATSVLGGFCSWPFDQKDFILIGECEEIQGPSTFLVIPESATEGVDTNGLILQLLSADYQGLGEGGVIPYEDTQSLLPDIRPNIHVLVNYFVLLDIQARGYVRPMCIAYVTADKFKLAKMFLQLRNALVQACLPMKSHNWQLFCEELKPMIANLRHTKKARESVPISQSPSVVEKMQDENLDEALQDLEAKLTTMTVLVEQEREWLEESLQEFLKNVQLGLHSDCPSYVHLDAVLKYIDHEKKATFEEHKPQILKVPLRQNFGSVLRPVTDLACLGLVKTIYELHKALKYFQRHYECIALAVNNDQNLHGMCLHFGACVKTVCLCGSVETKSEASKKKFRNHENCVTQQEENSPHIDESFFKLFQQITNRNETLHLNHNNKDLHDASSPRINTYFNLLNKRHDLFLNQMFDIAEELQGTEIEEKALSVLQSVFHKEELLYSIFKGRTVLILASAEQRPFVEAIVAILSVIVPTSSRHPKLSELWTARDIQESDLSKFAIIGLQCSDDELNTKVPKSVLQKCSVFNMKRKKMSFPHYKGELLVGIAKTLKNLSAKGPLMSVLISFLSDLELKVQFFRLLIEARGEISAFRHFLNKGYSEKDTELLWRLNGLLE